MQPELQSGVEQAVDDAQYASMDEEQKRIRQIEEKSVKKLMEEYDTARKFDKRARAQYAVDRRYAAGTADATWAVNTNLIGSFIDILVSFLYARDPDVKAKKAPHVDNTGTKDMDALARTIELVVRKLWKQTKLKQQIKKQVRSALTTGVGWIKAVMICDAPVNPQMESELNDLRDNIAKLTALQDSLAKIEGASTEQAECELSALREQEAALNEKVEASIRKYLAVDFVPSQNFQVSLDVASTEDYLDADWCANCTFILKSQLKEKFPRLTEEEVKSATSYYQREQKDMQPITDKLNMGDFMGSGIDAHDADQFVTGKSPSAGSIDSDTPAFAKVIELWDRRSNHIKTMVKGVNRWAVEPFQPNYASSRFYPYFRLAFFEVDGSRHPQSLSWRLHKLQDEYARSRSNWRLMRERAIPATLFNKQLVSPENAKKIEQGVHQEFIGIEMSNPDLPLQNAFAPKPYESVDPRMYDNSPIVADMEKISGVQEALQSSAKTPKTATEATIEQSGFASRTTADRDTEEDMLSELAQYTAEVALGALKIKDAQRIAGPAAYWPHGIDVDDLLTMVEIEIEAGSTGKPNDAEDKQAWGVIMPVLKDAITEINAALGMGNIPLAKAYSELVRITMNVMGDTTDLGQLLPEIPELPDAGILGADPSMVPPGVADPSLPPMAGAGAAGAPPIPEVPELSAPNVQPPVL